jgi:membrane-associated phospholipid phosphatase
MLKFLETISDFGGGSELLALFIITFLVGSRPKAMYFMTTLAIDKVLIGFLKLAYKEPRPYLKFLDIEALSCSKEFGNPSGHSSAAFATSIVLFLDIFHGINLLTIIGKRDSGKEISKYFHLQ